jgi:hypothetical protein
MMYKNLIRAALMAVIAVAAVSCTNDINRSSSPVQLIVTNSQEIQRIDLAGNGNSGNTNCDKDIGQINVEARLKNPAANINQDFNDVRITRYRVSYRRIDGGTAVPAPFVRPISILLSGGSSASLGKFIVLTGDAITQAPFASLLPQNGGRDPQTGRAFVSMEVILEVFGETLSGSNVSGSTSFPLDFCIDCNGCD